MRIKLTRMDFKDFPHLTPLEDKENPLVLLFRNEEGDLLYLEPGFLYALEGMKEKRGEDYPRILLRIEEKEGHINFIDDRVIDAHAKYGTRFPQPRKFPIPYDRTVYQMIAFCDSFDEALFLPHLHNCKAARWDEFAVDIMPMDSDKAKGIAAALEYTGGKREETLSIGDGMNDREMLEYTELSVAMGNASDEVKKIAGYVTDDIDKDGWAKALVHFGIISEEEAFPKP